MALFELEALRARHGDCIILHYGPEDRPQRILIDGGPAKVYDQALRPRLEELRAEALAAGEEALRFRMLMISHIDDDHINGVLELFEELEQLDEDGQPLPYFFDTLWHNSFDDLIDRQADALQSAALEAFESGREDEGERRDSGLMPASLDSASLDGSSSDARRTDEGPGPGGEAVAASVPQGRRSRRLARKLGIPINKGLPRRSERIGRLVVAHADSKPVDLDHGLTFRVLGPSLRRVERLQKKWDKELVRKGLAILPDAIDEDGSEPGEDEPDADEPNAAEPAAFVDRSVFNLASLIVLAELGDERMLLPGDARGDDILEGLEEADLMTDFEVEVEEKRRGRRPPRRVMKGGIHLDLLKLPHHGSDRNVTTDFFRRVRADRYVVSGDGRFGNPEPATFEMIFEARAADDQPFVLELTYGLDELHEKYPLDQLSCVLADAEDRGIDFQLVIGSPIASEADSRP